MQHDRKAKFQDANAMMSAADGDPTEPVLGAARVGAELRAARQRLGWALPDVAANLRIRLPYLQAIEDGRMADLPGAAYAVGFMRTYATSLGLDAGEVARRFKAEAQDLNKKTKLAFPAPVPERGVPAGAVVLLGVLLTAGAYAGWYAFSGARPTTDAVAPVPERLAPLADGVMPSNPSPQVASVLPGPPSSPPPNLAAMPQIAPLPAAAPPAAPVPMAAAPAALYAPAVGDSRVVLRLKSDAWIQVRERQGQVLLNRVMRSGETWPVPKGAQLLLTTGNAGGTELLVDGATVPSLGPAGVVRRDVVLDPDVLKAGSTQRPASQ